MTNELRIPIHRFIDIIAQVQAEAEVNGNYDDARSALSHAFGIIISQPDELTEYYDSLVEELESKRDAIVFALEENKEPFYYLPDSDVDWWERGE